MGEQANLTNRELSWLEFNARVLSLARRDDTPVLERAKFLAIFSNNLDEFFQVRVAGLREQAESSVHSVSPDGLSPDEQLDLIRKEVAQLVRLADEVFLDELLPALADEELRFVSWNQLTDSDRADLGRFFDEQIFPVLTPLAVDPAHPFPYISDLSLSLAVVVADPTTDVRRFARVKVPPLLPRFVSLSSGTRFVPIEQIIAAHLQALFPGMLVEDHVAFRVTRNADLDIEEDGAEDLLEAIETEIRMRRFGAAVRLEVEAGMSEEVVDLLQRELELEDADTYVHVAPVDLTGLWDVYRADRPDLKYPKYKPVTPPGISGLDGETPLLDVIADHDVLVHHPYESFAASVEAFVSEAASDPAVVSIKQTLYRTAEDSDLFRALIRAAESGKQVVALVELKARFDEMNNIEWARRLERAGVHVVYGLVGLKTHCKICLVARAEGDIVRRYCHVGTGNYNADTARLYEDVGLLTSDERICSDAGQLFNFLTGFGRQVPFEELLVAPDHMRSRLVELIRNEREAPDGSGSIILKMNSLVDKDMIEELYAASADGVRIDLLVRGICCLRAGVPGLSENIRVRSIVGRYLEHSRIYRFANGAGPGAPAFFIGSADLMPRNLDRRIEALAPVNSPELGERLDQILQVELEDDTLAWSLDDATWVPPSPGGEFDTHLRLEAMAHQRVGDR